MIEPGCNWFRVCVFAASRINQSTNGIAKWLFGILGQVDSKRDNAIQINQRKINQLLPSAAV